MSENRIYKMSSSLLLATLTLALSWPSHTGEIVGHVVSVADGDTINVLDINTAQV